MPIAVRSSDSTTTMRTKHVIMIRIDGASERIVISATICISRSVNNPEPLKSMERPLLAAAAPRLRRPMPLPASSRTTRENAEREKTLAHAGNLDRFGVAGMPDLHNALCRRGPDITRCSTLSRRRI